MDLVSFQHTQANEDFFRTMTTHTNPLDGLFTAHGQFLNFLSQNSPSASANTYVQNVTSNIASPTGGLGNLSIPITGYSPALEAEYQRLTDKKTSIDAEWNTRQRLVTLSQSTLKRNQQYNNIVALVFLALLVILVFQWFLYPSGILPAAALDLILVFIVTFLVIWMLYIAYDVSRRDNMDYDSINLGKSVKPNAQLTLQQLRDNAKKGIIGTNASGASSCQGADCCQTGTFWAAAAGQCVPNSYVNNGGINVYYSLNGTGGTNAAAWVNAASADNGTCSGGSSTFYVKSAAKCLTKPTGGDYDPTNKTMTCPSGQSYDPVNNTCVDFATQGSGSIVKQQGFHTIFGNNSDRATGIGVFGTDITGDPQSNSGYEFQNYSSYRK